ncbi:MAG: alpha/beta fold hydrolase [Candidatus Dormibacteria bacterium]
MRQSKLGLATGLGLALLSYAALVGWARRTLVRDRPPAELEAALQAWLGEAGLHGRSRYFHTRVGRVHVLLAGHSGSPVLLLPGLASSAGDFAELLAQLARHHRVAAIDLPGGGLSDPVSFGGHPRQAWSEVVSAVADQLGVRQFDLVGHSLGGLAAGGFAIANPERVSRLVLISPLGFSRRIPLLWSFARIPGALDLRGLHERWLLTHGARRLPDRLERADRENPDSAWGRYRLLVGRRQGHASDLDLIGRLLQPFGLRPESQLLPALGLLADRTLVLWGDRDRHLPLRDAEPEIRYYRDFQLEVVPGEGHLLPVLEPLLTARLITDFLEPSES